jgi:membrane protease YdiL (CAAX protease family)
MPVLAALPEKIVRNPPPPSWSGRGYVWAATFLGSGFLEIVAHQFGLRAGIWLPLAETACLLALAMVAAKVCPIKNLAGFILAIAAMNFGWLVVVPWLEASGSIQAISNHLGWGGRFFLGRAIRTAGAFLMIFTLAGSRIGPRELFLRVGNWRAPVQTESFLHFRRPVPWGLFAAFLSLLFAVASALFLFFTLRPRILHLSYLVSLLPLAVASSALNAANEEFQFRSVLLARLKGVIPQREAFLVIAVVFGVGHYFGQPSGWTGVLMAGIAAWVWAKSMVETRGFACAFMIHFVEDLVLFGFLAASSLASA